MVKKLVVFLFAVCMGIGSLSAQPAKTCFTNMPDSLSPLLTAVNRADFIDFLESKMKAEVTNGNDGAYSRLYPCAGNAPKHLANEALVRERQYPSYLYRFHRMRSGLRQSYQILHYRLERVAVRTLSGFTTGYGRFHHARFRYDRCVSVSGCAAPSRYALDESRPFG